MSRTDWPSCQVCGKDVKTYEGVITIYGEDVAEYQKAYRDWVLKHPDGDFFGSASSDKPARVRWNWGHSKCLKEGMYEITYKKFDSLEKAFAWTLYMMDKSWFPYTRWEDMIRAHYGLPDA